MPITSVRAASGTSLAGRRLWQRSARIDRRAPDLDVIAVMAPEDVDVIAVCRVERS
jgi:hypothetical protein